MRLTGLFKRDEQIAGLQISDGSLKLALLRPKKSKKPLLIEEVLSIQAIENGIINNEKLVSAGLENLLKPARGVQYVVLSLPVDNVYTKIITFPRTVSQQKLIESVKLQVSYQLPFDPQSAYADWQVIKNKEEIEVLLTAIPKKIVDDYTRVLTEVGLKIIAVEIQPLSLSRTLEINSPILVTDESAGAHYAYIFADRKLKYHKTLSKKSLTSEALNFELKRVLDFYESSNPKIEKNIPLAMATPLPEFAGNNQYLIALGAAVRGQIERSEDKQINLMPLRSETAYSLQRALSFSSFVKTLSIALGLLFVLAFVGAWFLMFNIQERTTKQIANHNALQVSPEAIRYQEKAVKIKSLTETAYPLVAASSRWSTLINDLSIRTTPGITVTAMSLGIDGTISITGQAGSRTELNQFKKSLTDSPYLQNVNLPLINLEQRANIPFNFTATVSPNTLGFDSNK